MGSTRLVEEPISAELALVDHELARRARIELPDPPWLLPVLAEQQRAEAARPKALVEKRPPQHLPRVALRPRPRKRSSTRHHIAATLAGGFALLILVVLVASAAELFAGPDELTFSTTPVPHAPAPQPNAQKTKRSKEPTKRPDQRSGRSAAPKAASPVHPPRARSASAPKRSETKPRTLPAKQRLFSWRRDSAAVYYQLYVQRGSTTVYQARTAKLRVVLPARLKLRPGTYKVLVRPAVTTDTGIILGPEILAKTIRV